MLPEKEGFLEEGTFGLGFKAPVRVFKAKVGSISFLQERKPDVFTGFKEWQVLPALPGIKIRCGKYLPPVELSLAPRATGSTGLEAGVTLAFGEGSFPWHAHAAALPVAHWCPGANTCPRSGGSSLLAGE